jgi:hypothetical protein
MCLWLCSLRDVKELQGQREKGTEKVTFSEHEEVEWWRDHEEEDGPLM